MEVSRASYRYVSRRLGIIIANIKNKGFGERLCILTSFVTELIFHLNVPISKLIDSNTLY
jgi:hypothetical protein